MTRSYWRMGGLSVRDRFAGDSVPPSEFSIVAINGIGQRRTLSAGSLVRRTDQILIVPVVRGARDWRSIAPPK